jgi:hypothetical protein
MSDDMDPMAEIRASFFIECEDLLEALHDGLQTLWASDDGNGETINVVFRAVSGLVRISRDEARFPKSGPRNCSKSSTG